MSAVLPMQLAVQSWLQGSLHRHQQQVPDSKFALYEICVWVLLMSKNWLNSIADTTRLDIIYLHLNGW